VAAKQLKPQSLWAFWYLVLAGVGIMLAIPPGYASPIFPAAGFAVAIMLCYGHRVWPSILLGSFVLNLFLTQNLGIPFAASMLIALAIGAGASLQAYVAARLVKSVVKEQWHKMEGINSIIYTLLLAGPAASLVAATNANLILYLSGLISLEELPYSWWNWWIGDSLGVLVMLPICLAIILKHERVWKNRIKAALLPIVLVIIMAASAFIGISRLENEYLKKQVFEHGESFKHLLQQRFTAHQEAIAAMRRLIEVTPEMTVDRFEYFTHATLLDNPDISALSVNAYVKADQRHDFEQRMRQMLNQPGFKITEIDKEGNLITAGQREDYVAVQLISPLQSNTAAIGYDINSESLRREAIRAAILTGKPAVTAPIQLVQGQTDIPGLLVLHPAFSQDTKASGDPEIFAFAVGVLNINQMVDAATAQERQPGLRYRIVDRQDPSALPIYQTSVESSVMGQDFMVGFDLMLADRYWHIEVTPTQYYLQQMRSWTAWAVGVGGLLAAAMLQILVLTITGQNSVIRRKVEEQTRELRFKNKVISDRNAQLDALFQHSPDGLVAFAEDDTIKYANPALLNMLELEDERGIKATKLDALLQERLAPGQSFNGLAGYFSEPGMEQQAYILNLVSPKKLCLQVLGIHTGARSIPRILYFRDITHEFEIQKMKSDFLSHAAHELRTPMTTILGYTELLLSREYSKEVRDELLQTVQRQTSVIVSMINDLLDLARIEANSQPQMYFSSFDLVILIRELVSELTFDQQRWPVKLVLPVTSAQLLGDRQKMRQAIMNLIVNAQKFSPSGGKIEIELLVIPEHYHIQLRDHGIGMTEDELSHVVEKFWRADNSGSVPGTGLGVAIVREIVQLHAGTLSFSSKLGQGTLVIIRLPRKASQQT